MYNTIDMKRMLLHSLLCTLVYAAPIYSDNATYDRFSRYLGLAIPYPDTVPELSLPDSVPIEIRGRDFHFNLDLDYAGSVTGVQCTSDSVFPYPALAEQIGEVRFAYLPGRGIPSEWILPVAVSVPKIGDRSETLSIAFPVSPELKTDSALLRRLFEANDIDPPRVTDMPPVTYVFDLFDSTTRFWTVTMQVALDEDGELLDITYPNPKQSAMAHQVHMAVVHASFEPARLNGEPFPADFLLTFRIFDNIDYPYSPFQPVDTVRPQPVTARYFMTPYYNENDVSIFPLPKKHPYGYIRGAKFADHPPGFAELQIALDRTGQIEQLVVTRCSESLRPVAFNAAQLTSWYPGVDASGETIPFRGRLRLTFNGTPKVVYIPEWFTP